MKRKMWWIILSLALSSPAFAQVGAYRVMNISDARLPGKVVIKRNFKEIALKSMNDLAQPLYPGDAVRLLSDNVALELATPQGDQVTLTGAQDVRLPNETGTWWNLKQATFSVTHPVKAELQGVTISADRAVYQISTSKDNAITVQVKEGSAAVTSYYHGMVSREVPAGHTLTVSPGKAVPEPQSIAGTTPVNPAAQDLASLSVMDRPASSSSSSSSSSSRPTEIVPSSRVGLEKSDVAAAGFSGGSARPVQEVAPDSSKRRNPPTPYAQIPSAGSGRSSWFSRNKWFVMGAGLVTGGVVAATVGKGKDSGKSPLSELPGPPGPNR